MPKQREDITDQGITGICLPTGEIVDFGRVKSFNYNSNINALRFSFSVQKFVPISVDSLTSRVKSIQESEGRSVVIAHKFFRHLDTLYVQDADIKVINV